MTTVAGHKCDQCNTLDVVSYNHYRSMGGGPQPKRGWFVVSALDQGLESLWFCSDTCVVKYMAART